MQDKGFSVDIENKNGDTPIMFASGFGHLGVVAVLMQVGVNR